MDRKAQDKLKVGDYLMRREPPRNGNIGDALMILKVTEHVGTKISTTVLWRNKAMASRWAYDSEVNGTWTVFKDGSRYWDMYTLVTKEYVEAFVGAGMLGDPVIEPPKPKPKTQETEKERMARFFRTPAGQWKGNTDG